MTNDRHLSATLRALRAWAFWAGLAWLAATLPMPVAAAGPRNLAGAACGASVRASSEVGRLRGKDHTARTVIDGQIGPGYWCTAFDSRPPHWLELDLGGAKRFDEVVLHLFDSSALRSCRVERREGDAWIAVAEPASARRPAGKFAPAWEYSDAPAGVVRCRFPAVTTDRVRLWFDKEGSVRLYEVEVFEAQEPSACMPIAPPLLDRQAPVIRVAFGRHVPGPGWVPVAAGTGYTPEQGIGWTNDGHRADCDRHGGATVARRFVAGWGGPGRLRLDLPPGRYVAALVATDFALPVRPFRIEGAGVDASRPLATVCRGAWDTRRFRVEAGPKGVELTFRGEVAWLINALLIAPESNLDTLLVEIDRIEEQIAFGSPEWMEKRKLMPAPTPAVPVASEGDRVRGYVLFTADPLERIHPESRPQPSQVDRPLTIQAAPGEAGVATLGVVPLRPLYDLRLSTADLSTTDGARIPASALDARIVRCWPQIDKTPAGRGKVRVIPELLESQDRHPAVCAPRGATRQYWITVRVPGAAAPGRYRGRVRFSAEDVAPADVPVDLVVLPFRLETPPEKTFFMYSILGDLRDEEIRPLLRDMRGHGMNSLASDMAGTWTRRPHAAPVFDPEPLRRVLRLAKEQGFNRPMPWSASGPVKGIDAPEGSEAWNAVLADLLAQVRRVQEDVGGPEALFYPVDEPFGIEERLTLAERAMRVARRTRALRTYCTPAEKDIARLGALLDVRCYAIGTVTDVREAGTATRAAGAAFWWYTNAARELPDVRRYLAGVWFWSTGADGQGYWVYQSRWRRSRPFQDLEGDLHEHDYATYPDLDGPIPTIQWECIRMGIDDARYLYTLEAALDARPNAPEAAAARRFLDKLRERMPRSVKLSDDKLILYECPWTPAEFAQVRRDIVRHILALTTPTSPARP